MSIEEIVDGLIKREGGFVDHPDDKGGATTFGITEAVARANGFTGPMAEMPVSTAREIYRQQYYLKPGFGRVALLSALVAEEITDTGVNMGTDFAVRCLQRCLNALNRQSKLYPDILLDGKIGQGTLEALDAYLKARGKEGENVLLKGLNCLQGARYIELAEQREANESFVYGWLKERVTL
jgi:lysozyme family protein